MNRQLEGQINDLKYITEHALHSIRLWQNI